jgi:hypothetical protein
VRIRFFFVVLLATLASDCSKSKEGDKGGKLAPDQAAATTQSTQTAKETQQVQVGVSNLASKSAAKESPKLSPAAAEKQASELIACLQNHKTPNFSGEDLLYGDELVFVDCGQPGFWEKSDGVQYAHVAEGVCPALVKQTKRITLPHCLGPDAAEYKHYQDLAEQQKKTGPKK